MVRAGRNNRPLGHAPNLHRQLRDRRSGPPAPRHGHRHHKICRGRPCLLSRGRAKHADRGASHRLGSVLAFAREKLGAYFICAEGLVFVEQPEPARAAVQDAVLGIANSGPAAPFALAALHVMTTLTGSVLLALAVARGVLTPAEAWTAAHVDEDFRCALGARTQKRFAAARGNGTNLTLPQACFTPSMAPQHESTRGFRSNNRTFARMGNVIGKQEDCL